MERNHRLLWIVAGLVLAWFVAAEIANFAWYASHESGLAKNRLPSTGEQIFEKLKKFVAATGGQSKEQGIGDAAMEMLKCSYGRTLIWMESANDPVGVTTIRWNDRSIVGGLESMHNPGNCLRAAGWTIGKKTEFGTEDFCGANCEVTQWEVSQGGHQMLAYSAVFRRFTGAAPKPEKSFWNNKRLQPVFSGRRDAPVLILLGYLPVESGSIDSGHVRFQQIMHAVFCPPGVASKTP